jgi:transposase InsO family protein
LKLKHPDLPAANACAATTAGIQAGEGKLYLCAVKDVHSNRIVGYSIDSRMKSALPVSALRNAIALRDPVATVVHSFHQADGTTVAVHPDDSKELWSGNRLIARFAPNGMRV